MEYDESWKARLFYRWDNIYKRRDNGKKTSSLPSVVITAKIKAYRISSKVK